MADIIRASLPGNRSEDERPASDNNVIEFPRRLDARDAEIAGIRDGIEALRANIHKTLKFYRLQPERRAEIESKRWVARNYPNVIRTERILRRIEKARRAEAYDALAKAAPDIHEQIKGRELELIRAVGIQWPPPGGDRLQCPVAPHLHKHNDSDASWRWDIEKARYFCACGNGSAIDVVMQMLGLDFKDAVKWTRETLDLPRSNSRKKFNNGEDDDAPPKPSYQLADAPPSLETMQITHLGLSNNGLPSQFWIYRAADGRIAQIKARYEKLSGGKEFRPWTYYGWAGWDCKQAPSPRPLYNLPDLLARPDADILHVEGEKAVDAAADIFPDLAPTTTGSKTSHKGYDYSPGKGRRVWIWPDNDHDGGNRGWIEEVSQHYLKAGAVEVLVVPVPGEGWPDGWDLADAVPDDAIDDGAVRETLQGILDSAQPYSPSEGEAKPGEVPEGELPPGVYIDTGEPLPAPEYRVQGMVPKIGTGLFVGQRGAGKTAIAMALAAAEAAGSPFFGHEINEACGVIYFAAEGVGQIRHRMRAAKMKLGITTGEIPLACIEAPRFKLSDIKEDGGLAAFIKRCKETDAYLQTRFGATTGLIIIDTLIKAYDIEDENDAAEIAAICKSLADISEATGCFAFGVAHAGKNMAAGARGSSAWLDNVDIGLFVSGDRDEVKGTCENRALSQTKNRDGPEGPISGFDLTFVELGKDAYGRPFGAMAVKTNDKPVNAGTKRKPTDAEIVFEKAFNELAIRRPNRIAVGSFWLMAFTEDDLREEFYRLYVPGKEGDERAKKAATRAAWNRAFHSIFIVSQYPRENREGVGWVWSIDEQREAWNAKERNERERQSSSKREEQGLF
jgi:hypothetical protein